MHYREHANMHRFFLAKEILSNTEFNFPNDVAHQINAVLRLKSGDAVEVLDNEGGQFLVSLSHVSAEKVMGRVEKMQQISTEPHLHLSLCVSLTKREKFETILQKATEIGVSAFVPFVSRHALVRDAALSPARMLRWRNILKEAAEQSRRGLIPTLHEPQSLQNALVQAEQSHDLCLIAYESEQNHNLADVLPGLNERKKVKKIAVFIGPEGGFAESEVLLMRQKNVRTFSLGPRTLRMETAAIIVPALLLYLFDQMKI